MKHFLFDIGRVLVDYSEEGFLSALSRDSGRPLDDLSETDILKYEEVEKGLITDAEFVDYLNESKGLCWTVDDLISVWSRIFEINETGRNLFLDASVAGVPVYTLSNIAQHHLDAIENNWGGFFDRATGMFLSYKMGVRKPDTDIYQVVLHTLGVAPEDCFFIDDRADNIEAAKAAGMNAHQYLPSTYEKVARAAGEFFNW